MDRARKRLEKELDHLRQNSPEGCSAQPMDGNLFEWIGTIEGPQASPYAGRTFNFVIRFPQDYPLQPPTVTSVTKTYHPIIDSRSGFIGLSILSLDWSPVLTVSQVLLSLSTFLANPDPGDAVVPEIAHEYQMERSIYEKNGDAMDGKVCKAHTKSRSRVIIGMMGARTGATELSSQDGGSCINH
ncbi:hypothetical protein P153DRAFT_367297 [Dothidotthia symphoricarpi CBS 119687]|uniref:UBC core domain-containing protein n=1 Tax=Dothidotthia symphoricarpi CBS 119687 TaxID=1392245 RepID=A0A6A6AF28_9PLEO|nr:uncharacterized protein P153DRAFT_367297 [Dothidotthia symphoricarpi CBS 119687]KAF2129011.1 hypothetical protein P153DRAFT_367297 [Dothidotthia symphoricarpi CBS 119687]